MATLSKFRTKVVSLIEGEEAEALSARIETKARAAFKGQIAALESRKVEADLTLEDAKNDLGEALYPASGNFTSSSYINGIKTAQEVVDAAQAVVDQIDDSIEFYNETFATTFE